MPHTTFAYGFEWRVLEMAVRRSQALTGDVRTRLFVLDADGSLQSLGDEAPPEGWVEAQEKLKNQGQPHLFLDPFDAPEYTWLAWFQIDQPTMERLLGSPFREADFVNAQSGTHQPFPLTWGVMI